MKKTIVLALFFLGCIHADKVNEKLLEWHAEAYSRYSQSQRQHQKDFFDFRWVEDCKNVLDIGARDGRFTALLAEHMKQGKVVGLEHSDSMLAFAKNNYPALNFIKGTIDEVILEEKFDYVIGIHAMHWVASQEKGLQNIYSHLIEGGKVFFCLAASKQGLPFANALEKTKEKYREAFLEFKTNQQVYDMETYRQLVSQAGFHIDSMHYVYTPITFTDRDALQGWLSQWLPERKFLPLDEQGQFMNDLIDAYLEEIKYKEEREIPWGEYVILVHATK